MTGIGSRTMWDGSPDASAGTSGFWNGPVARTTARHASVPPSLHAPSQRLSRPETEWTSYGARERGPSGAQRTADPSEDLRVVGEPVRVADRRRRAREGSVTSWGTGMLGESHCSARHRCPTRPRRGGPPAATGGERTPGCGQSCDPPEDFSMEDYARCLRALPTTPALRLAPPRPVRGGTSASEFHRLFPQHVRSLIIADSYAGWTGSLGGGGCASTARQVDARATAARRRLGPAVGARRILCRSTRESWTNWRRSCGTSIRWASRDVSRRASLTSPKHQRHIGSGAPDLGRR